MSEGESSGRLYYDQSYLQRFEARVLEREDDGRSIYLDRTAFYPTSGGQPHDLGTINGVAVTEVEDRGDRIRHVLAIPLTDDAVTGEVDWGRRYDHMQQHTGQHLLSAVLAERFGIQTVSFHLGQDASTIDVATAALTNERLRDVERACNGLVWQALPVTVGYEDAEAAASLRKQSDRSGLLRVVTIGGIDRSACGGTHLRSTAEIGAVLLRRTEKVRGQLRLEFLCGGRALQRSRTEFETLTRVAKAYSGAWEEAAELVERQGRRLQDAEKGLHTQSLELARMRANLAFGETAPGEDGIRRYWAEQAMGDEARAFAQTFTGGGRAVAVLASREPVAVLLSVSSDSGFDAGVLLRTVMQEVKGKGGGNSALAQGSAPSYDEMAWKLRQKLGFA